jgi:TP901 family phage tail tape measure protein
MALSTRELLLVLRARDEASRVLNGLGRGFSDLDTMSQRAARNQVAAGSALVGLGAGIAGVGVAALDWMAGTVKDAADFEHQVSRVMTQTDKVKTSQQELGKVVKTVAKDVAVPIEELSNGLYDIFSSMDVSVPQAQKLLEAFAKEAVAGQVSVQDASRATIGIMNAFHIPVDKVNDVLDVQFQLVRKGVGTFAEFNTAIGKATPSATRAGQSVQELAGMMAFMTRNGMTAAQAGTSAARAFDALANPKVVKRLEDMGVKVRDSKGEFRGMSDIMQDLQKKLSGLTDPQRAEALQKLFLGAGGTIQARRFYDMVLKDKTAASQFVGLVGDMNNASGAFTGAYDQMAGTAISKTQVLKNQWELVRIEVGEALMPILSQLLKVLSAVLGWWNNLSDGTKNTIIWIAAGAAAFAVILGVLIAVAGAIMMVTGAAAGLGIGVGALIGIFAAVVAGIAAVVAIGYLIVKNWDWIKATAESVWNGIVDIFNRVVNWIKANFGDRLKAIWDEMQMHIQIAFQTVRDFVVKIWNDIVAWTSKLWGKIQPIIQPIIDWLVGIWDNVVNIFKDLLSILISTFKFAWEAVVAVLKGAWDIISGVIEGIWNIFKGIIDFLIGTFTGDWQLAWDGIKEIFTGIWDIIKGVFVGVWDAIKGIVGAAITWIEDTIGPFLDLIKNGFQIALETIQHMWEFFWNSIKGFVQPAIDFIIKAANWFRDRWNDAWKAISDVITRAGDWINRKLTDVGNFFKDLPNKIKSFFSDAWNWLIDAGQDIIRGLLRGIENLGGLIKDKIVGFAKSAWQGIKSFFGISSPSKLMRELGQNVGKGMALGLQDMAGDVSDAADDLAKAGSPGSWGFGAPAGSYGSDPWAGPYGGGGYNPSNGFGPGPFGSAGTGTVVYQSVGIYTSQIDPQRNASDLGFALANGVAG